MKVLFFHQELQVETLAKLREMLSFMRDDTLASFWLIHEVDSRLAVLINAEQTCVNYFPNADHPGFYACGKKTDWDTLVHFIADNSEATAVPVARVLTLDAALGAAEEFFVSGAMPPSLTWEEL